MTNENIEKKLKKLPLSSGVYLFKDANGTVLYVGKSASLRARVRSHFRSGPSHNPVKNKLINQITDIEIRKTESEIEALVLEAQLIKSLKPRFNVLMRDSKNYAYVAISKEKFPRIFVTHQPVHKLKQEAGNRKLGKASKPKRSATKELTYIGPFTEARALRRTLRILREIFPYWEKHTKPSALERQLGLIPPDDIPAIEYRKNIRAIQSVLTGKRTKIMRELKRDIERAAKERDFERAHELKTRYEHFQSVVSHAHVLGAPIGGPPLFADVQPNFELLGLAADPNRIEAYDISNIQGDQAVGSMIVFERDSRGKYFPRRSEYRKFKIRTVRGANDPAMINEVISRRIKHIEWPLPDLIVVDGGRSQLNAALKAAGTSGVRIIALAKRFEDVYFPERTSPVRADRLGKATKALLQAMRDETHRFAVTYHRTRRNKAALGS